MGFRHTHIFFQSFLKLTLLAIQEEVSLRVCLSQFREVNLRELLKLRLERVCLHDFVEVFLLELRLGL